MPITGTPHRTGRAAFRGGLPPWRFNGEVFVHGPVQSRVRGEYAQAREGALSALQCSKETKENVWIRGLLTRCARLKVAVALANKTGVTSRVVDSPRRW
jgi:hypothetical protein